MSPARGVSTPRRGFSLIELLLVIGLFLTLMGIAVASVVRAPRLNRLVAAEQVISDAIRQARHTARTSGQPVVLRVRKDSRSVSGLVTQPLWHGTEGWPGDDVAGVTGGGFDPGSAYADGAGGWDMAKTIFGVDQPSLVDVPMVNFQGGQRLWRGSSAPQASILLSVCVKPPAANGGDLPLVMIGPDAAGMVPLAENSAIGLALRPSGASWTVVGWCGDIQAVSHDASWVDAQGRTQEPWLIPAGAWIELAMLVERPKPDEVVLTLYRDGRAWPEAKVFRLPSGGGAPIALAAMPASVAPIDESTQRIYIGIVGGAPTPLVASSAVIDNVRLDRLGDAMSGTLPAGVILKKDVRITCHPNGRVESEPAVIELANQGDSTTAEIKVDVVGAGNVTTTVMP